MSERYFLIATRQRGPLDPKYSLKSEIDTPLVGRKTTLKRLVEQYSEDSIKLFQANPTLQEIRFKIGL